MSTEAERDDELARDPVLASALQALPPVEADPAFRARLRERFLGGDVESSPGPGPTPRRGSPLRLVATLATLAAAVLAVFLLVTRDGAGEDSWILLHGPSGELVYVDDLPIPADDPTALASALAGGARLRTPERVGLSLRLGDRLALHVGPQSEVRLPRPARGLRAAPYRFGAEVGHLALVTGPGLAGHRLLVRSPELEVEVLGTRFAVDVAPDGSCVCCTEGTLAVRSLTRPDQAGEVSAGAMALGMPDGSLKFAPEIVDDHVAPIEALVDAWR